MIVFRPPQWGFTTCARCRRVEKEVLNGDNGRHYCLRCVDQLIASGKGEHYHGTSHTPENPVWQVHYHVLTTAHLRTMLDEHAKYPLFNPVTQRLLSFFIANPTATWLDAASHVSRRYPSVRDILLRAVECFQKRQTQPTYQPKGLTRRLQPINCN